MTAQACDFGLASKDKHHFFLVKHSQKSCLICHKGGDAFVCSNWDCPIIVHQSCMPSAAHFDDTERFYCPYCLYKQSLVECHQAKAKAFLANRALISFLDTRTRNYAEHLKNSRCLKRKNIDAPTIIKKRDDAKVKCYGVYQPTQVEGGHQDDSHFLGALSGNLQQAGRTKGHCLGTGSLSKDYGNLPKNGQEVKGVKCGKLEEVQPQTQACLTIEDSTKEIHEKSDNKSDGMLDDDLFTEILNMRKLAKTRCPHDIGDSGTNEDKIQVKSPKNDVIPSREDNSLVTQHLRNSTNELEETAKTVEKYYSVGVKREQTQTDFLETALCLTKKNTLETNENFHKGNDCAFQDNYFVRNQVVENFDRSCEMGGDFSGRTDDGGKKEKIAVYSMKNTRESLPHGGLGNSTMKHLEIEQTVERYHDRLVEKVQAPEEPKETSVFGIREDNAIGNEKPDEIIDSAYQDDYSVIRQLMVNSGNLNQRDGIGKHQCRMTDEGSTNFKSPIKPFYPIKEDNEAVKDEKSGIPDKENEKTSKPVEQCYRGQVTKEQTQQESRECCVLLSKKNTAAMTEKLRKVKDSTFRDAMVQISENVEKPAENGKDCLGNILQDVVYPTRENNPVVTHKLGKLTMKYLETKKTLEGYHDRVAEIEQTQTNLRSTREDDKKEMAVESGAENYSSSYCGMTDDEKTRVKSLKSAPQITRNRSVFVSCEKFGSIDESSNTNYLDHGKYALQERKIQMNVKNVIQHGEYTGNSDDEVEECVQSKYKVKSVKQIQWSTILPVVRRRKLPWTAEEVKMLKEGVQKFSLTVNKNLPWMKILENGHHIFEGTRTPADLKDKWKNIKGKENTNFDAK